METKLEIFKSEWAEWKRSNVTKKLVQEIFNKREYMKEGLAEGAFESEKDRWTAVGRCQGMRDMVEYIISDFEVSDDTGDSSSEERELPND